MRFFGIYYLEEECLSSSMFDVFYLLPSYSPLHFVTAEMRVMLPKEPLFYNNTHLKAADVIPSYGHMTEFI